MSISKIYILRWFLIGALFVIVAGYHVHCSYQPKVNVPLEKVPFQTLSPYHFFDGNMADLTPNDGVLPYNLNSPLFSDYAHKKRFVWMPEGKSAEYKKEETFEFPVGAVLIKNFYYPKDFSKPQAERRIIETRLLVHRKEGWDSFAYVWNEEQTKAKLEIAGATTQVSWVHHDGEKRQFTYSVPNKNQCKGCHTKNGEFTPIGPKAGNMNKAYPYPTGADNQLQKWKKEGYLRGAPSRESLPQWADYRKSASGSLAERARAYLDINCAHCHNPEGPASTTGFNMSMLEDNPTNLGICKPPIAAGRGSGGFQYDIKPGHPQKSILTYRMKSTDPGIMMPELGRKLVHEEGVELVSKWIANLEGDCKENT